MIEQSGSDRKMKSKFKTDFGPSDDWFEHFKRHHPELKWSMPQQIEPQKSVQANEYVIDNFFNKYGKLFSGSWNISIKIST